MGPLGRWAYIGLAEGSAAKEDRRKIHRALMASAAVLAMLGLSAVVVAHWEPRQYFGYDFYAKAWKPALRLLHVFLGWLTVVATVAQAGMGLAKASALQAEGKRTFTF